VRNPPVAWVALTLACLFVGVIWILAFVKSPWPIVGWIVGCAVISVPLWLGVGAIVRRRREG
jgi:hypothetical protein